jgi:hypothetical protein
MKSEQDGEFYATFSPPTQPSVPAPSENEETVLSTDK